jgi:hypothetical protein
VAKSTESKKAKPASRKKRAPAGSKRRAPAKREKAKKKTEADGAVASSSAPPQPAEGVTAPLDATANAALAGEAALAGARAAGQAVSLAVARAGVPLAAGGGLAAGVAGGLAVLRRRRRRVGGFDIGSAAERVGSLGEEVGRVAIVIQKAADGSKRAN